MLYKKYASLYFIVGIDSEENELSILEVSNIIIIYIYLISQFIHLFVEILDKYFGSVCELDVVYNFYKVYGIIDDMILGGELIETSKNNLINRQRELEYYD